MSKNMMYDVKRVAKAIETEMILTIPTVKDLKRDFKETLYYSIGYYMGLYKLHYDKDVFLGEVEKFVDFNNILKQIKELEEYKKDPHSYYGMDVWGLM